MTNPIRPRRIVDQITTATDKRFELVARIADSIVETTLETGGCDERDILAKGYSQQESTSYWHFANALAAVELRCRENKSDLCFKPGVRYA